MLGFLIGLVVGVLGADKIKGTVTNAIGVIKGTLGLG